MLGQNDIEVLSTLAHEMVHAATDEHDHRRSRFRSGCIAVGLTKGRPCATEPGVELRAELAKISRRLGPYPHLGIRN